MKDVKFETVEWYNGEFLTVLADKRDCRATMCMWC